MVRCCECKKIIWWWQGKSNIALVDNIHSTCHLKLIWDSEVEVRKFRKCTCRDGKMSWECPMHGENKKGRV